LFLLFSFLTVKAGETVVCSPDGRLEVNVLNEGGLAAYTVSYDGHEVISRSALGMVTSMGDLSQQLVMTGKKERMVSKEYQMNRVKKSSIHYQANRMEVSFMNRDSISFTVVFEVSNDNVAFKYQIPRPKSGDPKRMVIKREVSSFCFPDGTTTFLTPQIGPESGWQQTKPSYEEDYETDAPMTKASRFGKGYTFPCLFKVPSNLPQWNETWVLVSETGVNSAYCGSHLSDFQPNNGYTIAFPDEGENNGVGNAFATIPLPGETPWRTITVGSTLAPIVETTIPYDLVEPLYEPSQQYTPGRYTWSWLIWQDQSVNYDDQVRFIDLAAAMGFEYCLVDNWWDTQIGRDRIVELSRYAQSKGVSLMLWYNSNGYWNDAPQTPRDCMSTSINRDREMRWLQSIGVKGIKVDFFGGDKQETMRLYEDILCDANRYGLQVVFHGCTIPRGWERMYPNYVASEAALASENVFFSEYHARKEGFELTIHPFCRNAVGTFDWGGIIMNRYLSKDNKSRHPRYTSDVFELATGLTNQTSIQCVAMQPNNLSELPDFELDFMKQLPTTWDETRFIDGYPGKYAVLARRHGDRWYVAGLNGTDRPIRLELDLSWFYTSADRLVIYNDNPRKKGELVPESYRKEQKPNGKGKVVVTMQPMGGMIIEKR
jgi:hypothetical protein